MRLFLCVLLGVLLVPTLGLVGDIETDGRFKSTMSSGAPFEVASDEMVANLNADMVDGLGASDFASAANTYTRAEVDALLAAAVDGVAPKEYYLSTGIGDGAAAKSGCGDGFHMASLWEIADPSNLRYAYDRGDAVKGADTENGPPTDEIGWIRTGFRSQGAQVPGRGNCDLWTSASTSDFGSTVTLPSMWSDPAGGGFALVWGTPWAGVAFRCDNILYVWCVED